MEDNILEMWNEFREHLYQFIKARVSDEFFAEDILQDVFIKLYRNVDRLEDKSKLKTWLYKITKNTIIDYYRKVKEVPYDITDFDKLSGEGENQEEENFNTEIGNYLKNLIFELPKIYQEALVMYEFDNMKHKEIAEQLKISVSGSKTRVQRGREMMKLLVAECCDFEVDAYGNIIDIQSVCKTCDC